VLRGGLNCFGCGFRGCKANNTNYLATNIYRYQDYFIDKDEQKIIALFEQTPFLNPC
jgi:hypothetical protein